MYKRDEDEPGHGNLVRRAVIMQECGGKWLAALPQSRSWERQRRAAESTVKSGNEQAGDPQLLLLQDASERALCGDSSDAARPPRLRQDGIRWVEEGRQAVVFRDAEDVVGSDWHGDVAVAAVARCELLAAAASANALQLLLRMYT